MSPQRVITRMRRHRLFTATMVACCLVIIATVAFGSDRLRNRTSEVDDTLVFQQTLIYQNCVANETQDAVFIAQLEREKREARAKYPKGSAELIYQLDIINEGIDALEPPNEPDCVPPEGTEP